jgi:hypothetical protein
LFEFNWTGVGTLTDNTPPIPPQNRDGAFLPLPDPLWPRHSPSHAPIHPRSRNRIEMAHFSLPPPLWPRHSPSHAPIHPLSRNSKGLSNFSLPPPLWVGASPSPDLSQPLARYVKVEFTPPGVHATGCWALAKAALGAITGLPYIAVVSRGVVNTKWNSAGSVHDASASGKRPRTQTEFFGRPEPLRDAAVAAEAAARNRRANMTDTELEADDELHHATLNSGSSK